MSTDEPTSDEENGRIDLQHCSMEGGVVISDTTAKKGGASKWGPKREVVSQITTGHSGYVVPSHTVSIQYDGKLPRKLEWNEETSRPP